MTKNQIDFRFSKNWKKFMAWYDAHVEKAKTAPRWDDQARKIELLFNELNPSVVNWKQLWKDLEVWYKDTFKKNGIVLWSEQKRQIETLMLAQVSELNQEQFILVFMHKGKPETSGEKMTYWEALRVKRNLDGDSNGRGGDENVDGVTIVNLKNLIQ